MRWRRRHAEGQERAERFDAALDAHPGVDRTEFEAELRAARHLESQVHEMPSAPHEPLVALRAALAARAASARPRWQQVAYFRAAPAMALAAIVALVSIGVAELRPETLAQREAREAAAPEVLFRQAETDLQEAEQQLQQALTAQDPVVRQQATRVVTEELASAQGTLRATPPAGPTRRALEERVRQLQAQVEQLNQKVVGLVPTIVVPTVTVPVRVPTTTTTTTAPRPTTTTTVPPTTTTTARPTTTTTTAPTTTTTTGPTSTTSTTVLSDPGTGTTG